MDDSKDGSGTSTLRREGRRYKKVMRITIPFFREIVVLSECKVSKDFYQDATAKKENERRTKIWISERTEHAPGCLLPFQEVYRDYYFESYTFGEDVTNESRFSQLFIETYRDQGITVGRRRVDNRATFTDVSFTTGEPSMVGPIKRPVLSAFAGDE